MGRRPWATEDQLTWLEARIADFHAAQAVEKSKIWMTRTTQEYFDTFWKDGATGKTHEAMLDADGRLVSKETRMKQFHNWFYNRREGLKHPNKGAEVLPLNLASKKGGHVHMYQAYVKLHGERIMPILHSDYQAYLKKYAEDHADDEEAPAPDVWLKFMGVRAKEMLDNESEEVKAEVAESREKGNESNGFVQFIDGDEGEPGSTTSSTSRAKSARSIQSALEQLPKALKVILERIEEQTGWKATILLGGPRPDTGELSSFFLHQGVTLNLGNEFPQASPQWEAVVDAFNTFIILAPDIGKQLNAAYLSATDSTREQSLLPEAGTSTSGTTSSGSTTPMSAAQTIATLASQVGVGQAGVAGTGVTSTATALSATGRAASSTAMPQISGRADVEVTSNTTDLPVNEGPAHAGATTTNAQPDSDESSEDDTATTGTPRADEVPQREVSWEERRAQTMVSNRALLMSMGLVKDSETAKPKQTRKKREKPAAASPTSRRSSARLTRSTDPPSESLTSTTTNTPTPNTSLPSASVTPSGVEQQGDLTVTSATITPSGGSQPGLEVASAGVPSGVVANTNIVASARPGETALSGVTGAAAAHETHRSASDSLAPSTTSIATAAAPGPVNPTSAFAQLTASVPVPVSPRHSVLTPREAQGSVTANGTTPMLASSTSSTPSPAPASALDQSVIARPEWIDDALRYFMLIEGGEPWKRLLAEWLELEKILGFPNGQATVHRLSSDHRPEEVKVWMKNHRHYDKMPRVKSPAQFAVAWKKWWTQLQPSCRELEDGSWPLPREEPIDATDWDIVAKGGPNGFFLVVLTLGWWLWAATNQDIGIASVLEAIEDVIWVCQTVIVYLRTTASVPQGVDDGNARNGDEAARPTKRPRLV